MTTIIEIILDNRLGGIAVRALSAAKHLRDQGINTVFVVPNEPGDVADKCRAAGFHVHQIALPRPSLELTKIKRTLYWLASIPFSAMKIKRLIIECNADVVHVNGLINVPAALAARLTERPIIWHLAGTLYPRWIVKIMMPYILRHASVVTISQRVREYFVGQRSMRMNEWIIYEPIEVTCIANRAKINPIDGLRNEFSIPPEALLCVSIGNLSPLKGFHILLDAVASLRDNCPMLYTVVIGAKLESQHGYIARLQRSITDARLHERFFLADKRDNVCDLLTEADIFVLASFHEGTPISIMEAMASGLPVLATSVGGIPDQITHNVDGILIPPGDSAALAIWLRLLVDSVEMRQRLGSAARLTACEKFSMKRFLTSFTQVVRSTVTSDPVTQSQTRKRC